MLAAIDPQYLREAAEVINEGAGGPPDRVRMEEIMCRHGLTQLRRRVWRHTSGSRHAGEPSAINERREKEAHNGSSQ